jgi:fibronectin-binding autotransporter adhesin
VVRVFDVATNTQIFAINAYDASYRDSIRIAMGDINGDGYDDIITSTRKTTGSVRVFDGRTGERFEGAFAEIAAFTEKGARGAFVASGDVTGDGRDDIIVGSGQGARGSAKVKVFDGRTGDLVSTSEPFGTKFRGGVRVAAGDVNGDGLADIIAAQGYGGNDVKVTSGTSTTVLHNLEIGGSRYRGGVFVAVANLDGDDSADLIVGRDRGPTVIETFSGATGTLANTIVPFGPKYRLGVRVAAADINFDGIADIVAGAGGRGRSEVKIFDGTTGSVLHTFTAFPTHLTGSLFVAGTSPVPAVAQFNEQPA